MGEFSTAGTHIEYTFVWQRETNNLLVCNILGCFVDPVWELRCQMVCPESLVMAVPVADNLTPMTAVTSVGNLVIMPMTVIVSTSGIVDAAGTLTTFFMALLPDAVVLFVLLIFNFLCLFLGQDLALVPDLMAGATALVAAAMKGKSSYCSSCVWTDLQSMHQSNFMTFVSPILSQEVPFTFILKTQKQVSCVIRPQSCFYQC